MEDKLVTIATFSNITDAEIFRERLESGGIEAYVSDGNVSFDPTITTGYGGGVRLTVQESDEVRAAQLVAEGREENI